MEITVILTMFGAAVGGAVGGYLSSYAKKKGEHLATKEDFEDLLMQLKLTTKATEQIKSEVSRAQSVAQSDLEFRKQQLEQFYGPIYARLKINQELYRLWMDRKVDEVNDEIKSLFRQDNREIIRIITTKSHLIDGDTLPSMFTRFMTSATIWNFYTEKSGAIPENVSSLLEIQFPKEFETYISNKTEELKRIVHDLHKKYGVT